MRASTGSVPRCVLAAGILVVLGVGLPASPCHGDECPAGTITTVAGTGQPGYRGAMGTIVCPLGMPGDVAVGLDGSIYVSDMLNHQLQRVKPDGSMYPVIGTCEIWGARHIEITGVVEGTLAWPGGVAVGADGSVYVADSANSQIKKINLDTYTVVIVAGTGERGYGGDDGPATEASLSWPNGVAAAADGSMYIADAGNNRIRKVGPDGVITTVAGDGWKDKTEARRGRFRGDGGPAIKASLNYPESVAVAADGTLYIADMSNNRIRKVDGRGIITTIAGDGRTQRLLRADGTSYLAGCFGGDGGPATKASLSAPRGVTLGPDGCLYFADCGNERIRKIAPDGIITTVAGTGEAGYSGDGGPAAQATLNCPAGLAFAPDGSLYIADMHNDVIRKVCRMATPPADQ